MKKRGIYLAVLLSLGSVFPAQAGQWQENTYGIWRYQCQDGDVLRNGWYWIDGNEDGEAECYYFGPDGTMYEGCMTPDGYEVDSQGRWVQQGNVQRRREEADRGRGSFEGAVISGRILTNSWADYRLTIPEGSNVKGVSYTGQNSAHEDCLFDVSFLAPEEAGGFSAFIWYEPDRDKGLTAEGQLNKHRQKLLNEYGYEAVSPAEVFTIAEKEFYCIRTSYRGQSGLQLMRKVDDKIMRIGISWKSGEEGERKAEGWLKGIETSF